MTAILIRKPGVEPIDFRLTLWLRHPAVGGGGPRPHKYKCTNAPTVVWCIEAAHINICAAVGRRPTQYLYKLYEITFRLKFKSHVISMYYIILYIRSK